MLKTQFLEYLELEKNYSPHTLNAYERDLESFTDFLQQEYSQQDLLEVNYAQIRSWIVKLVEEGISNRSVNRKISSLKAFYKFQVKTGAIPQSPLLKHKTLKTPKKIQTPFSEKEVGLVLNHLPAETFEELRNRSMLELLYSTGMRRAELISLKLRDVDFNSRQLKVLGKRNKERIIPMLNGVMKNLQDYLEARKNIAEASNTPELLVTSKGVKLYESLVYRVINSYFSEVSVKLKKSPHILRHSFATHLLNQGANLNAVKELLGHSSLASTQVYTHNNIAQLSKAHKLAHPRNKKS